MFADNPRGVRKRQNIASFDDRGNILPICPFHVKQLHKIILSEFYANFDRGNILPLSRYYIRPASNRQMSVKLK